MGFCDETRLPRAIRGSRRAFTSRGVGVDAHGVQLSMDDDRFCGGCRATGVHARTTEARHSCWPAARSGLVLSLGPDGVVPSRAIALVSSGTVYFSPGRRRSSSGVIDSSEFASCDRENAPGGAESAAGAGENGVGVDAGDDDEGGDRGE